PLPSISTLFPYTTLFRSRIFYILNDAINGYTPERRERSHFRGVFSCYAFRLFRPVIFAVKSSKRVYITGTKSKVNILDAVKPKIDRKSTRLNSSHVSISY